MTAISEADAKETTRFVGAPDGPMKWVDSLEMEVGTFIDPRKDLLPKNRQGLVHVMYHVPEHLRGMYSDPVNGEEIHPLRGVCMCFGVSVSGNECQQPALNRSGYCAQHGGALHPLDKVLIDWESMPRAYRFERGKLPVEELDDEELARGQVRREDGTWTNFKQVPISVHDRMVRELFDRADTKLKANLVSAVDAMTDIAKGTAYEPADRIKAASWIYERVRGKVPTEVVVSQDRPWEMVMSHIAGGSRAESRAARGADADMQALDDAIDADIVEAHPFGQPKSYETEGDTDWEDQPSPVKRPGFHPAVPEPVAEPPVETTQELADRLMKAKRKRYASRSRGLEAVEVFPYTTTVAKRGKGKKGFVTKFVEPKLAAVPREVLAREKKNRRREWD